MPARAAVAVLVEGRAIQRINNIDEATQTDTNEKRFYRKRRAQPGD